MTTSNIFRMPDEILIVNLTNGVKAVSKTLKALVEVLPEIIFVRILTSFLVNMNNIKSFGRTDGQGSILKNSLKDAKTLIKNE